MKAHSLSLTPKNIFQYLEKFIIGQTEAKKSVSIALRNRWRRKSLSPELQKEIFPKNILMVGPTGSGKTEIARRLASLTDSPFIKVEATKYTEIGYYGKDVDEIIQDLVRMTVKRFKSSITETSAKMKSKFEQLINKKLCETMLGIDYDQTNEIFVDKLKKLEAGEFDERLITLEIPYELMNKGGFMSINELMEFLEKTSLIGKRREKHEVTIGEAKQILADLYTNKLERDIDYRAAAIQSVEQEGIVFIDEIDKIANPENNQHKKSVSADGVQRDLLPLIEGTVVNTKYGDVRTDHILFIASGAFHTSKPTDLMPELLGRLPIRVELKPLTQEDFKRILKEPKYNLIRQQIALLEKDKILLKFEESGIEEIAKFAFETNVNVENIGARRLHSLIEKVLEEISFEAPGEEEKMVIIDRAFVQERLKSIISKMNYSKYLI